MVTGLDRRTGNLPAEVTSFVGRRDDIAKVEHLLTAARLVTLTGPGGVGKSRLAVRVASRRQRAFRHGTWLVEMAGVHDPQLVAHTVAEALQVVAQSGRTPSAMLVDFLRTRQLLMILDNCEHVSDACAVLANTLLRAAAGLRILATSRKSLGITGEHIWRVAPLQTFDPDQCPPDQAVERLPALALFADRAAAVAPSFALNPANQGAVAQICRRLDGIPLAIELAAVRLRALSVSQLSDRLDDRFGLLTRSGRAARPRHHQTLEAAMRWSYELCAPPEQLLWRRLSIFAGGMDASAAETVCPGGELPARDVLTALGALVDKSVLTLEERAGQVRYRMLETVREYGYRELRDAVEQSALRRAHRDFYLGLAERFAAEWFGPDQLRWLGRLRAEHDNLRAALEYCLTEPGQTRAGMRLATGLSLYWRCWGNLREGRHWLHRFLAADRQVSPERVAVLAEAGFIAAIEGDLAAAEIMLTESRALSRQLRDDSGYARATQYLAVAAGLQGRGAAERSYFEEAVACYAGLSPPDPMQPLARLRLALCEAFSGDPQRALERCDQCRRASEQHGELWVLSLAHHGIAFAAWRLGRLEEATRHALDNLRIRWRFSDVVGLAQAIELLAWITARTDQQETAATLLGAARQAWQSFGLPLFGTMLFGESHVACENQLCRDLGTVRFDAAFTAGTALALDEAVAYAVGALTVRQPAPVDAPARATGQAGAEWGFLTNREREVANLIGDGLANKEIAARLVISTRTAESHVEHILAKLGVTNRAQIAALIATWQADDR